MSSELLVAIYGCAILAGACQLASMITREHSWVDRLWSIAPALYVLWFAASAGRVDLRLAVMGGLVTIWGARLTYNFARKGGYRKGGEDYRWPVLRRRMSPAVFAAFNLVFINGFQHGLLLLIALPAWIVARRGPAPPGPLDAVAAGLAVVFLVGEAVADQQQWTFHLAKAARGGGTPGFLSDGLFRYSRHPNFFCEQGFWWAIYLFGVAAGAPWLNPSLAGPVLLTALFQGSTAFTEAITATKYPDYADYQRRTSRLIPWFARPPRP